MDMKTGGGFVFVVLGVGSESEASEAEDRSARAGGLGLYRMPVSM